MGGVVRRIRRAVDETAKAVGVSPTKREQQQRAAAATAEQARMEQQRKAAEAQQSVQVVDAPSEPNNPADVIYSGQSDDMATGKKKRRRRGTIMTSSQGVMGAAPTDRKTLLGS